MPEFFDDGFQERRDELIHPARISNLQKKLDELGRMVQKGTKRNWQRLLGDRFDELFASRSATDRSIEDDNPSIRAGALSLVALHWGPRKSDESLYRRIFATDLAVDARIEALGCLIALHKDTKDFAFCTELAKVVRADSDPVRLRMGAYYGIMLTQGWQIPIELPLGPDHMPHDLDWAKVDLFLE